MSINTPGLGYAAEHFTGIRPSDPRLTVANYIGAVDPILRIQDTLPEASCQLNRPLLFVADMHAFTDQSPVEIIKNREDIVRTYLALGVDPERTDIYVQSQIGDQVLQATMALARFMTMHQVSMVPTLKDKVSEPSRANMLLAQYPIMMAADILLQRAHYVPTGLDQKAHIEVARNMADMVNRHAGRVLLPKPEPKDVQPVNVMALKGEGKMSKTNEAAALMIDDDAETITRKIKKAQTGIAGVLTPQMESLVLIGSRLTPDVTVRSRLAELLNEHLSGEGVAVEIKSIVLESVLQFTRQYQDKQATFAKKPDLIKDMLSAGGRRAAETADATLDSLKDAGIGLRFYA